MKLPGMELPRTVQSLLQLQKAAELAESKPGSRDLLTRALEAGESC